MSQESTVYRLGLLPYAMGRFFFWMLLDKWILILQMVYVF